MYVTLNDVLGGNYKGLNNKEVGGFRFRLEETQVVDDEGSVVLDENCNCMYEINKIKEDVRLVDSTVCIKDDGIFEVDYEEDDEITTITYVKDAFIVPYLNNNSDECYFVAYPRYRVKGYAIISGEFMDSYIENKRNGVEIPVCKSVFNTNINLSTTTFANMDEFMSAEKDTNLTYIVGDMYEVYFDGCLNKDSKDYSDDDYNDWFVHVMRNDEGVFAKDGALVYGYLLNDFINNREEIENCVRDTNYRVNIYNK